MGDYNPWQVLAALPHIVLRWECLTGRLGEYRHHAAELVLDPRMRYRQRRCTLAHELEHARRGDVPTGIEILDVRQELVVDKAAARALLDIRDVAEVLLWTNHLTEAAEHLAVDVATLVTRLRYLHPAERHLLTARLADQEQAC